VGRRDCVSALPAHVSPLPSHTPLTRQGPTSDRVPALSRHVRPLRSLQGTAQLCPVSMTCTLSTGLLASWEMWCRLGKMETPVRGEQCKHKQVREEGPHTQTCCASSTQVAC